MNNLENLVTSIAQQAKRASYKMATLDNSTKSKALEAIALELENNRSLIKAENALDIKQAQEKKLSPALTDRLTLTDQRINDMIAGVRSIALLPDPIGKLITSKILPNKIELKKIRVPLGVIGIIFESRPNVVVDVAALCLKSGNAVILRGGSESEHSNRVLLSIINSGLEKINFTPDAVQMLPIKDRVAVNYLCKLDSYIDLIIPRGGEGLIRAVVDAATVPVIKHYKGICHAYIDENADITMALAICENAKCQRPSACNSVETILVHENIAADFLPKLEKLFNKNHVEMRGCESTRALVPSMKFAHKNDWESEYLDLIIAIKIVHSLEEAINHINTHGSHHSDTIITKDREAQRRFVLEVDSAAVYVNASTRFTDGGEFGLGAEMGISTDKLHARGPMGINELTTYKWVGLGSGQVRT
jgi:glutamate-5-semialdehyde dehydrogenase